MLKQTLLILGAALLLGIAAFLLHRLTLSPQPNRAWIPEQSRVARATLGDTITLHNVRDWTYSREAPLTTEWSDVTIDPQTIERAWFYIEPFSDWEAVGHTFLGFELSTGEVYTFSVEARREAGEEYSAVRGLMNEYELSYQWGRERDFVTRRLTYLDHPLRMYPLALTKDDAIRLFEALIVETNALAETPRFYNTLSANCTNVLASIVNTHYKGRLMYDLSWYLTGYADEYLMREGLIEMRGSIGETKAAYDLTPHRGAVAENATAPATAFSARLRSLLP